MEFKKKNILPFVIFATVISGCAAPMRSFSVGDKIDKFVGEYISNETFYQYMGYSFVTITGQNIVVFSEVDSNEIQEIEKFEYTKPSTMDFERIESGMTVFEAVSLVGIPYGSQTSGAFSLMFKCFDSNQDYVTIYFNNDSDLHLVVAFVSF
ncbi:MAG TPA: hypothetical protein PKO28_04285 [Bacilli bacterium]|nr:hypothetical protein [Bacilli bacterium]